MWYRFASASTFDEAQSGEIAFYPSVPNTGCLLQPIQHSFEPAHMRLAVEDLATFGMLYVHLFLNDPIENIVFTSI